MRTVYKISAYLTVLLGIAYIVLTPFFFRQFGLDVLWFAGTGLAFIFLGNLNLMVMLSNRSGFYMMAITSNIMALLLTALILTTNAAAQSFLSLAITVVLAVASVNEYIRLLKKMVREEDQEELKDSSQGSKENQ
ncbi:MAG TPA: hypothetical protein VJ876_05900 [Bacteroidales bacterium]|nr:hypothetical protein [Bacteroidales bacterium]